MDSDGVSERVEVPLGDFGVTVTDRVTVALLISVSSLVNDAVCFDFDFVWAPTPDTVSVSIAITSSPQHSSHH